jgi:hemoglobin
MDERKDISNLEDIKTLVDNFYQVVRKDKLLGKIFNGVIQDRWPVHLDKMYRFWQTVLLSEHTYYGSPFAPHAKLPVSDTHFERWMKLFVETIDLHFAGPKAEEAKWRAEKMAKMFQIKIDHYQNRPHQPLL